MVTRSILDNVELPIGHQVGANVMPEDKKDHQFGWRMVQVLVGGLMLWALTCRLMLFIISHDHALPGDNLPPSPYHQAGK